MCSWFLLIVTLAWEEYYKSKHSVWKIIRIHERLRERRGGRRGRERNRARVGSGRLLLKRWQNAIEILLSPQFYGKITKKVFPPQKKKSVLFCLLLTRLTIVRRKNGSWGLELRPLSWGFQTGPPPENINPGLKLLITDCFSVLKHSSWYDVWSR